MVVCFSHKKAARNAWQEPSTPPPVEGDEYAPILASIKVQQGLPDRMKDLIFPPALCEAINMHFIMPMLAGMNASPGLLLHGPAGTGKSSIAKAVAGETSSGLIVVGPGDARSQWSGKADKFIQAVFER